MDSNVGPVPQYIVRAENENNAIMTFGLKAPDYDQAYVVALERLPWPPKTIAVQPLLRPESSGVEA